MITEETKARLGTARLSELNACRKRTVTAEQRKRIKGFQVVVLNGKELPQHEAIPDGAVCKINGPHTDAKWAKDVLGCNFTASERKARIAEQREKERQDRVRALLNLALQPQLKKKKWKSAKQLTAST